MVTFCFQDDSPMFLGERGSLLPLVAYYDPYDLVEQLRAGNINSSEDRDNFQELYALTSSPSSEILECAPSSHSSACSSRSFSPHTPPGKPPSSSSSPPSSRVDSSPFMYDYDMYGTEPPVHSNSVLEHDDALHGLMPSHSAPGRPLRPGQCCPVPDAPVTYFLSFLLRIVLINVQQ